ncbi:MAG: hypothetical protein IJP30_05305 [Clostridia bacterium]|nr:hypothetical protein [Clostridia bacterium]
MKKDLMSRKRAAAPFDPTDMLTDRQRETLSALSEADDAARENAFLSAARQAKEAGTLDISGLQSVIEQFNGSMTVEQRQRMEALLKRL